MKKFASVVIVFALLVLSRTASAHDLKPAPSAPVVVEATEQTAPPTATGTSKLAWDQAIDGRSLAEVNAYQALLVIDGGAPTVGALSCTQVAGGSTYTCRIPFPAVTPGVHSFAVAVRDVSDPAHPLDSGFSAPLTVRFTIVPTNPAGLRVEGGS